MDIHDREREVWEREKAKLEAEAEAEATRALAAEAVALATGSGSGLLRRNSSTSTGTGAASAAGGLVSAGSRGLPGVASRCVSGGPGGGSGWACEGCGCCSFAGQGGLQRAMRRAKGEHSCIPCRAPGGGHNDRLRFPLFLP